MKNTCFIIFMLIAILFTGFTGTAHADNNEVFDRIIKSGTIKCAYYNWPPFIIKDLQTGEIKGLAHDVFEKIAEKLSLKVEWAAEVNLDSMFEGYQNGRYDMICTPVSPTPGRSRVSDFTEPYLYIPFYLYAREDDHRFDNDFLKANAADVTYVSLDGEINEVLGNELLPLSKKLGLGNNSHNSDVLMNVATKKADVTSMDPVVAEGFIKSNPGKIRLVDKNPLRIIAGSFSIPQGEEKLKAMLNITTQNMLDTGEMQRLLGKDPQYGSTFLMPAKSYQMSTESK